MPSMDNKIIIGIIGGIGWGKSSVAQAFNSLGCAVINADKIAHEVLGYPSVIKKIQELFGDEMVGADGQVDRPKLAVKVFEDEALIKQLNSIIHPPVLDKCEALISLYKDDQAVTGIVMDVPLLMETGWDERCDVLVFVEIDRQKQIERLKKRGISEKQLKKREKFQILLDKKRQKAHYIVNNNSDISDMTEQVARIFSMVKSK